MRNTFLAIFPKKYKKQSNLLRLTIKCKQYFQFAISHLFLPINSYELIIKLYE